MSITDDLPPGVNCGGLPLLFSNTKFPTEGQLCSIDQLRPRFRNYPQFNPPAPVVFSAPGNKLLTAAQVAPWTFIDITASNVLPDLFTFPTAASLTAMWGDASDNATGTIWYFYINNTTANPITLVGNTGVVLAGVTVIPAQTAYTFLLQKINNSSYNVISTWLSPQQSSGSGFATLNGNQTFTGYNQFNGKTGINGLLMMLPPPDTLVVPSYVNSLGITGNYGPLIQLATVTHVDATNVDSASALFETVWNPASAPVAVNRRAAMEVNCSVPTSATNMNNNVSIQGIEINTQMLQTTAAIGSIRGIFSTCNTQSTGVTGLTTGLRGTASIGAAGTVSIHTGIQADCNIGNTAGAAVVTAGVGLLAQAILASATGTMTALSLTKSFLNANLGAIGTLKMFEAASISNAGSITVAAYGYYCGTMTGGTQPNHPYSFYASDTSAWNQFNGPTSTVGQTISTLTPVADAAAAISAATLTKGFYSNSTAAGYPLDLDSGAHIETQLATLKIPANGDSFRCTVTPTGAAGIPTFTNAGGGLTLTGINPGVASQIRVLQFVRTGAGTYTVAII